MGISTKYKRIAGYFVVLALVVISYSASFNSGYTNWDDDVQVYDNPVVKEPLNANIGKIFSSFYVGMYQPFVTLSFWAEYKCFGLNPQASHFFNILLHLINTLLVMLFCMKLTNRFAVALITGLLFGIHPMHTESVCWISERKDVLYAFFFLLGLILYQNYLENGRHRKYLVYALLMFLGSLLSKSAAVVFPLILILIDYYRYDKWAWRSLINKIPFLLLSLFFGILTIYSQGAMKQGAGMTENFGFLNRVVLVFFSFGFYLFKAFVPVHLSAFHPYPALNGGVLPMQYYIISSATVLFLGFVIYYLLARLKQSEREIILFCLLFFTSTILIVLQVPVGQALVAERYSYIPYLGVFLLISFLYVNFIELLKPVLKVVFYSIGFLIIVALVSTTIKRTQVWQNSFSLYKDIIEKYPDRSSFAYNNRGLEFYKTGNFAAAISDYNNAIKCSPFYAEAYNNRGLLKTEMGDYLGAMSDINRAISFDGKMKSAYLNRAVTKEKLNDFWGAISDYTVAISLDKDYLKAYLYRADDKTEIKDYSGALADLEEVVRISPGLSDAYLKKGIVYFLLNNKPEACREWQTAAKMGNTTAGQYVRDHCY